MVVLVISAVRLREDYWVMWFEGAGPEREAVIHVTTSWMTSVPRSTNSGALVTEPQRELCLSLLFPAPPDSLFVTLSSV